MITPKKATKIIMNQAADFGETFCDYGSSLGCLLKDQVVADRSLPDFDRVTMDGIAIRYADYRKGVRKFKIIGTQIAGVESLSSPKGMCIKIMTGASLDKTLDTIVPIEQVDINNDIATIKTSQVKKGQFIHKKGSDSKRGDVLVEPEKLITPDILAVMASIGMTKIKIAQTPKVCVISTGNELVEPDKPVKDFQIRRSNDLVICGILKNLGIETESLHVKDHKTKIVKTTQKALENFDVVILSGGVSKGDRDYVHTTLSSLGVEKCFHGVAQKPGKPFWFGTFGDKPVFALPGNPVSVYMCTIRYIVPWFYKGFGLLKKELFAVLDKDVSLNPNLTNFILVKAYFDKNACLSATPVENNNSGDFISMVHANAFLELPEGHTTHRKNQIYRIWFYKSEVLV